MRSMKLGTRRIEHRRSAEHVRFAEWARRLDRVRPVEWAWSVERRRRVCAGVRPDDAAWPAAHRVGSGARYPDRVHVPDGGDVVPDGAVGGEEAGAGGVQDRGSGPKVLVQPGTIDLGLAVDVGAVIGEGQVFVPVEQGRRYLLADAAERARRDSVQGGSQLVVL